MIRPHEPVEPEPAAWFASPSCACGGGVARAGNELRRRMSSSTHPYTVCDTLSSTRSRSSMASRVSLSIRPSSSSDIRDADGGARRISISSTAGTSSGTCSGAGEVVAVGEGAVAVGAVVEVAEALVVGVLALGSAAMPSLALMGPSAFILRRNAARAASRADISVSDPCDGVAVLVDGLVAVS